MPKKLLIRHIVAAAAHASANPQPLQGRGNKAVESRALYSLAEMFGAPKLWLQWSSTPCWGSSSCHHVLRVQENFDLALGEMVHNFGPASPFVCERRLDTLAKILNVGQWCVSKIVWRFELAAKLRELKVRNPAIYARLRHRFNLRVWTARSKAAQKSAATVRRNQRAEDELEKRFDALPKAIQAACRVLRIDTCPKCGEQDQPGTVFIACGYRGYDTRLVPCPTCGGDGKVHHRPVCRELRAMALDGADEATLRARNEQLADKDEDGGLQDFLAENGFRRDSTAGISAYYGTLGLDEAKNLANRAAHRHENTNYEALLASGCDRETARSLMEEVV